MSLNLNAVRSHFPALKRNTIFFDNPGGTQVPRSCVDRIEEYLFQMNANSGGVFATSRVSDESVFQAHAAAADFLNAPRPEDIIFGANMTTLTFSISRALGRTIPTGSTIILTRMDHEGNVSPWLMLAEDRGYKIRFVDFHPEIGTLDMEDMRRAIMDEKPALVAVGYASNALGTINPVKEIIQMAHQVGALTYIDAVQYAPNGPIDVQDLDCDFLVCSAYKFFGPHLGVLYGRQELLQKLTAYKVRPCSNNTPDKFETGTGNFEHMAGTLGALEYLEWVGQSFGQEYYNQYCHQFSGRRLNLKMAMTAILDYEMELNKALLKVLQPIPGIKIYGITEPSMMEQRVPTYSFTVNGISPKEIAVKLDEHHINVWAGNFYALEVTTRLGLEDKGKLLRVGPTHYNTIEEVNRFGEVMLEIVKG